MVDAAKDKSLQEMAVEQAGYGHDGWLFIVVHLNIVGAESMQPP